MRGCAPKVSIPLEGKVPRGVSPHFVMSSKLMNVVILAAGLGKRMHSDLPKVLHPLAGKPLLAHVVGTARSLKPGLICIVYGHGGERVRAVLGQDDLIWAKQET